MTSADKELNYAVNYAIKSSTADIEKFQFNTPIARMMELLNAITKYSQDASAKAEFKRYATEKLVLLLAPFAPHFTEELWCETLGNGYSVYNQKWPEALLLRMRSRSQSRSMVRFSSRSTSLLKLTRQP